MMMDDDRSNGYKSPKSVNWFHQNPSILPCNQPTTHRRKKERKKESKKEKEQNAKRKTMQIALLTSTRVSPSTLPLVPSVTITRGSRVSSLHSIAFYCSKKNSLTALIERSSRHSKRIVKLHSASDKNQLQTEIGGGAGSSGDGRRGGGGGGGGDNSGDNNEEEEEGSSKKQMAMSMSQKLTLGYAALVGVGGVMGYVKSGSQKSLAAGGLSSLLLYYVYTELPIRPAFASSLGLGLSAALLVVMGSRFRKSGKVFPAGVVSLISFVMTGGYLHGILRSQHA